jgi:cytochrome c oxidase assembly protein subunit 15
MKNRFRFWIGLSIVLVYGVIAAGAIVRMTGSGMGCPDWPKCFGYLIPPTEQAQLDWKAAHDYQAGQVIIVNEELRVANKNFRSSEQYNETNWEHYTKHDYALFNPVHTWIEFLNRLLGALGGLATLVVGILSFWHWKKSKLIPLIAWGIIFGMGFQAWLGKTVVDSNLQPFKITIHMVMALVIVALLLYLYYISKENKRTINLPINIKAWTIFALALTLVQIAMGTQVRQFVDEQIDLLGEGTQALWLDPAPLLFYVHRSFSLLVTGLNIWLFLRLRKLDFPTQQMQQVLVLIGLEIATGILMYYVDFPFSSQPLHLLFAALLFGAQSYLLFHLFQPTQFTSK